jgi:hypothetical protein
MRRALATTALFVLALLALATTAGATHSGGAGPTKDYAFGTGRVTLATPIGQIPFQIHVDAETTLPAGANGRGQFYARGESAFGPFDLRGRVTCVYASANRSSVGGEVTRSSTPLVPTGAGVLLFVTDNGEGSGTADFAGATATGPPLLACPNPSIPFPQFQVNQGNFVVHDGVQP